MLGSLLALGSKGLAALSAALGAGQASPPPPTVEPTTPPAIIAPAPPPAVAPEPTPEPSKPGPAARQRYRLTDASGQVWEHEDPVTLQGYVLDVNRRFAPSAPVYSYSYPFQFRSSSACAGGRCPR